jgi:hypothetical protein
MTNEYDPRSQRALRLAFGTALCLTASFGLNLPIPFLPPLLTLFLLASLNRPLPLKACLNLVLVVMLTTGSGLLLIPVLRYAPLSGVLLVGLCLFFSFRYGLLGGNPLVAILLAVGLTLISAAGTSVFALALLVIEALIKGVLLAVLAVGLSHKLFPEPVDVHANTPPSSKPAPAEANWIALRAALVVLPAFLLALIDPTSYMPLIMKSVSLGQQVCDIKARDAGRELLGSTLLGGLLAMLFWGGLGILPHLWLFFLWMLLFGLLLARKLYALSNTQQSPSFWLNSMATLIILLGQSVQDSAAGKDVYSAFAVRMGLFIVVTLYACLMIYLLDRHRLSRQVRRNAY